MRQNLIAWTLTTAAVGAIAYWWWQRGASSSTDSTGTSSDTSAPASSDFSLAGLLSLAPGQSPVGSDGLTDYIRAPDVNAPRGIRNNNPFNLRPGDAWQGLALPPVDGGGYLIFQTSLYGLRAGCIDLVNQQKKHGLNTVRQIISKFAPVTENNTAAYISAVSDQIGVGPDDWLDLTDSGTLQAFAVAVIQHENGQQPYDSSLIEQGAQLALQATA